ncbi:hypothetical protein [Actinoplanes sp. NPDC026670]|uniref:hypothetical protein n=1 Tax=Actinoplanes sp. NPDC026670 TaxID=3154700 RepID=UPI00340CBF24
MDLTEVEKLVSVIDLAIKPIATRRVEPGEAGFGDPLTEAGVAGEAPMLLSLLLDAYETGPDAVRASVRTIFRKYPYFAWAATEQPATRANAAVTERPATGKNAAATERPAAGASAAGEKRAGEKRAGEEAAGEKAPGEKTAGDRFRREVVHLSALDQGGDARDMIVALDGLVRAARAGGVDVVPVLAEVAAMSGTENRMGMGSTREILLRTAGVRPA